MGDRTAAGGRNAGALRAELHGFGGHQLAQQAMQIGAMRHQILFGLAAPQYISPVMRGA